MAKTTFLKIKLFSSQNYIFKREAFFNRIVMNLNLLRCSHFNIVLTMVKRILFCLNNASFFRFVSRFESYIQQFFCFDGILEKRLVLWLLSGNWSL